MSPAASVETISLGTPTGSPRIAAAATEALPEPPMLTTPCSCPSPYSRASTAAAPRPMTVIASPRSAARASSACSAPPARATSSREMSAGTWGSPSTPASIITAAAPAASIRSRR